MSDALFEFAKRFAIGEFDALFFTEEYMRRWREERDTDAFAGDSLIINEALSTIFCLSDGYDPDDDRREYDYDEGQVRSRIAEVIKNAE